MKFEDIQNGTYSARATTWGFGTSKEKGTRFLGVWLDVQVPTDERGADGKVVVQTIQMKKELYFTDGTIENNVKQLQAMGCDVTLETLSEKSIELMNGHGNLKANEVSVVIEREKYDAKQADGTFKAIWTPKVQWINTVGGGGMVIRAPTGSEASSFAAQIAEMAKRALATKSGNSTPRPITLGKVSKPDGEPAPEVPVSADDDIPF